MLIVVLIRDVDRDVDGDVHSDVDCDVDGDVDCDGGIPFWFASHAKLGMEWTAIQWTGIGFSVVHHLFASWRS